MAHPAAFFNLLDDRAMRRQSRLPQRSAGECKKLGAPDDRNAPHVRLAASHVAVGGQSVTLTVANAGGWRRKLA
jgi:hypothetical protein